MKRLTDWYRVHQVRVWEALVAIPALMVIAAII